MKPDREFRGWKSSCKMCYNIRDKIKFLLFQKLQTYFCLSTLGEPLCSQSTLSVFKKTLILLPLDNNLVYFHGPYQNKQTTNNITYKWNKKQFKILIFFHDSPLITHVCQTTDKIWCYLSISLYKQHVIGEIFLRFCKCY